MSVSASAENLSSDAQSCDDGSMCLELALEGERLCKAGDCQAGVTFFQEAIKAGTHDLRTLSAIYSQLGNAYFYLGDYNEAMKHHKYDLMLARKMNDALGEAKASGNLGNTLKVMGKFTEAIQCCGRHLEISRSLGDTLSEGRALYNLGNVYHAQGKQLGRMGQNDPGHFPQEVRDCLHLAVKFYEYNLELMRSLNDRQAMGRACGNLGNTYYLLGDFNRAIQFHTERLHIAQEYNDKPAERRANSNLGNSHIFLGQFENAAEHYKRTLALAEELGDAAVEAQACYSLGNTYTLLREYRVAEEYHARHLAAARKLQDRVGEGRACWSLGNAHAALGNHEKALYYAKEHYNISKELGDMLGVATAQMNIGDLKKVLGLPTEQTLGPAPDQMNQVHLDQFSTLRVRRQSMEQLSLIQITPDKKDEPRNAEPAVEDPEESLQDIIARCQAGRLNEQRVALSVLKQEKENRPKPPAIKLNRSNSGGARHTGESMIELLIKQSDRIDSQRAELPARVETKEAEAPLPGLRDEKKPKPDDDLLDIIERVQGPRLDDQRTVLPRPKPKPEKAQTMPEDDFFSRLMRAQASRMEEQRATIPLKENRANKADSNAKK